jgi:hypothetical protein
MPHNLPLYKVFSWMRFVWAGGGCSKGGWGLLGGQTFFYRTGGKILKYQDHPAFPGHRTGWGINAVAVCNKFRKDTGAFSIKSV